MVDFAAFRDSILSLKDELAEAKKIDPSKIEKADWKRLEKIFNTIKIMNTRSLLVGHSKVMAHLLPNLVPPIDRTYTLQYLRGTSVICGEQHQQWRMMRGILEGFFYPIIVNSAFSQKAQKWMNNRKEYPWDTSILKVVDNLILAAAWRGLDRISAM